MMDYYNILIIAVLAIGAIIAIYKFCKMERQQQMSKIKQWILIAVMEAESLLGSKTGQIKLRVVYNRFVDKFKIMSHIISYDMFCTLVDEALDEMKHMINNK